MTIVTKSDPRLLGLVSIAYAGDLLVGVSADRRRVVAMASGGAGGVRLLGESEEMDAEPGKVVAFGGGFWVLSIDGRLHEYSAQSVPVLAQTIEVRAWGADWLTVCGDFLAVPVGIGGVLMVDSTGAEVDRLEGVWTKIERACANEDGTRLYLFDGAGNCRVLAVDADGLMTGVADVQVPNAVGIVDCLVDDATLVAISERRLFLIDLADPDAPALTESVTYSEGLRAVCRLLAGQYFLASTERIALEDFQAPGPQRTAIVGGVLQVGAAATARMSSVSTPKDLAGNPATILPSDAFDLLNRSQFDGAVRCVLVVGDLLVVGGTFINVTTPDGSFERPLLCAFDLLTGELAAWTPYILGVSVDCLCEDDGGVAIGGDFHTASSEARANFASYGSDLTLRAISKDFDGQLIGLAKVGAFYYAVGGFSAIGVFPNVYGAKFDASASNYSWYSPVTLPRGFFYSPDTLLFYIIGTDYGVSVSDDGSAGAWMGITIAGKNVAVAASPTRVVVGARVSALEGSARSNWGATNAIGTLVAFAPSTDSVAGATADDRGAAMFSGADLILAADFLTVNGEDAAYVAAVDADGDALAWDALLAPNGAGSHCNALASYGGKVIMGGQFVNPAGGFNLYAKDAP